MDARQERRVYVRQRLAHFAWAKTLDLLDFQFQHGLDKKRIKKLAGRRFVEEAGVVLSTGPPGAGKAHLAIGLGMEAIKEGTPFYFTKLLRAR